MIIHYCIIQNFIKHHYTENLYDFYTVTYTEAFVQNVDYQVLSQAEAHFSPYKWRLKTAIPTLSCSSF